MMNPNINPANNRLSTSDGYLYDTAGNTTRDSQNRRFTYDAENKQTKVEQLDSTGVITAVLGHYFYDGDGKRVKKIVPGTGEVTVFVYDASGRTVAEYSTIVANTETAQVSYMTADHLGSPRVITDALGKVTSRRDFQPFGEEINAVAAAPTARTAAQAYTQPDNVRQKFTTYERDEEIDLDYAQARMYANRLGRFITVDPLMASAQAGNPQTWNRYIYALNNPLTYTDPEGLSAKPTFRAFNDLTEDEQRILNNSKVKVKVKDEKGKTITKELGGQELYDHLKADGNKKGNRQLAGFLNQTAVLANTTLSDGKTTAISQVIGVTAIKQDRITAMVDSGLRAEIERNSGFSGPENSSLLHGNFDISFRQADSEGSQQISFSSTSGNTLADIDVDARNPNSDFGNFALHGYTVVKNAAGRILPFVESRTNPYGIHHVLQGKGIRPSYKVEE